MTWIWQKLSAAKWEDSWRERLLGFGSTNLVVTQLRGRPTIRLDLYCSSQKQAAELKKQFGGSLRQLPNKYLPSPPYLAPQKIRARLIICHDEKSREQLQHQYPQRDVLLIPAEMAFGTGDHATTASCLRFLVDTHRHWPKNTRALDIGTGSGVLALAMERLGATRVEAFDFDPTAVDTALVNAQRNAASSILIFQGDVLQWQSPSHYDVIAANLYSSLLLQSLPRIAAALVPQGILILSGILREQAPEIWAQLSKNQLHLQKKVTRGKWCAGLCQKT